MAKKYFKGYKGKTSAKIIATAVTAGAISFAIIGGNIVSKLSNRPEPEHPYDDTFISESIGENTTNNIVTEPSIELDPSYENDYTPNETLPELQQPIIPDTTPGDTVDDMSVEFVEVLAKLTDETKEYIQSVHGNTPNITILGLNSMTVNNNSAEVQLLGQAKVNDSYNYFVASITNIDTSLDIYNLPADNISESEFIVALDELLNSDKTEFVIKLNQHVTLSNSAKIINTMLQTRLNDLKALNSKDQSIANEIAYLENLDTSKLELSVILNDRVATDNGHLFSFSIAVNTSKYLYTINDAIISKRVLTPTALKHSIEDHLSTLSEWNVNATPSSAVNQVLYVINDTAFNLYNNHSNTIG